jgi:hypothetical protein
MYTFPQGEVFCTVKGFKIVPWSSIIKEYGGCGQGNCRAHLVAMFIVDWVPGVTVGIISLRPYALMTVQCSGAALPASSTELHILEHPSEGSLNPWKQS